MNKNIKISKLEAAHNQLETAIELYFNDGNPISIHTLVCAAHEIIAKLRKRKDGTHMIFSEEQELINDAYKSDFRKTMVEAKNFFKHADKDPNEILDFNPEINEHFLLDACEGYKLLTGSDTPYFQIFMGWYHSIYPHILKTQQSLNIKESFGDNKLKYFATMVFAFKNTNKNI